MSSIARIETLPLPQETAAPSPAARITVAHGDGIGPEIMEATLRVLGEAGARLDVETIEIGESVYRRGYSAGIESGVWDSLRRTKVFLKAPITTPQGGGFKSLNVTVRKTLGLFANVRPCSAYAPFVATRHPGMDVVIVRENEEDLYAGIEHRQTDEVVQRLADAPELFDVVVLPNLYGDILSDVAAEIAGSVGLGASANIGEHVAMFEAIHGSAPAIAGKDLANPSGLLLSAVMMLVHVGQGDVAERIHNAWLRTIEDGIHTADIFSPEHSRLSVGTRRFAEEVVHRLGHEPSRLSPVRYATHSPLTPPPAVERAPQRKETVGVDVFLHWQRPAGDLLHRPLALPVHGRGTGGRAGEDRRPARPLRGRRARLHQDRKPLHLRRRPGILPGPGAVTGEGGEKRGLGG